MNADPPSGDTRVHVRWRTCAGDTWCELATVVLPDPNASGVTVVWTGAGSRVLFVGKGGIAKSVRWARQFAPIASLAEAFVTWATVPEARQDAIRDYLAKRLHPVHDEPSGSGPLVAVNLPWERE